MDVATDKPVRQHPHGVSQDIPTDGLDDVFHEFRAVRFDSAPFFLTVDAHVGNGLTAELIYFNPRFHVGQFPAGRQRDEKHPVCHFEVYIPDLLRDAELDRVLYCFIDRPPESRDVRIRFPPHSDQRLQFILGQAYIKRTHRPQSTGRSAVSQGEFGDFPFLPEM